MTDLISVLSYRGTDMDRLESYRMNASRRFDKSEKFITDSGKVLMNISNKSNSVVPLVINGETISTIGSTAYTFKNVESVKISEGITDIE